MAQSRQNRPVLTHCLANCCSFGINSYRASFSHGGFILPVALLFVRGPFASIKVVGGRRRGGGRKERNDLCSESCPTREERPALQPATAMDGGWHFGRTWKTGALSPEWPPKTNLTWHANDMRQAGEGGWKEGGPVLQQPSSQERERGTSHLSPNEAPPPPFYVHFYCPK